MYITSFSPFLSIFFHFGNVLPSARLKTQSPCCSPPSSTTGTMSEDRACTPTAPTWARPVWLALRTRGTGLRSKVRLCIWACVGARHVELCNFGQKWSPLFQHDYYYLLFFSGVFFFGEVKTTKDNKTNYFERQKTKISLLQSSST